MSFTGCRPPSGAEYNHALEYAILKANELRQPVVVFFGITDHFPEGNERHYSFMLEGLREVKRSLERRGIQMVVLHQSPEIGRCLHCQERPPSSWWTGDI